MHRNTTSDDLKQRRAPLAMSQEEFRRAGYLLIDQIAEFLQGLSRRPASFQGEPHALREALWACGAHALPEDTTDDVYMLLAKTLPLLLEHSVFNGHPRFLGFITSSPAPIGILGELLAAATNANAGLYQLAPIASEIEAQTIHWIAELIGYPGRCGGILVSGGNVGNFIGLLVARKAKVNWDISSVGLAGGEGQKLRLYISSATHPWIYKAADLSGLGVEAIRQVPTDEQQRIDPDALRTMLQGDLATGLSPFLVIGNAGTVSTGAVDPLPALAAICREYNLWFHVDGAYGGFAAMLLQRTNEVEVPSDLRGIAEADSVAVDPHKWLYVPLEAGCILVRNAQVLRETFTPHGPTYYNSGQDDKGSINYCEYGPQNSRGFRALKIWLALRQVGRAGYVKMLSDDIKLARALYFLADEHPELQVWTQNLSITTFRYVPPGLAGTAPMWQDFLNVLNRELLQRLHQTGQAFLSSTTIDGNFLLRVCVVNFHTSLHDMELLIRLVVELGRAIAAELQPPPPASS